MNENKYIVLVNHNNNIFIIINDKSDILENISFSYKTYSNVDTIISHTKVFTKEKCNEIKQNLLNQFGDKNILIEHYDDFIKRIMNHKCKCSESCRRFIYGGFYNLPEIGGISVKCYDRLSNNGKLSAYQVIQKIK